jgi:hypothetical protein
MKVVNHFIGGIAFTFVSSSEVVVLCDFFLTLQPAACNQIHPAGLLI